jgi:hypothetical protein
MFLRLMYTLKALMKRFGMRASPKCREDVAVMMLTYPSASHKENMLYAVATLSVIIFLDRPSLEPQNPFNLI